MDKWRRTNGQIAQRKIMFFYIKNRKPIKDHYNFAIIIDNVENAIQLQYCQVQTLMNTILSLRQRFEK